MNNVWNIFSLVNINQRDFITQNHKQNSQRTPGWVPWKLSRNCHRKLGTDEICQQINVILGDNETMYEGDNGILLEIELISSLPVDQLCCCCLPKYLNLERAVRTQFVINTLEFGTRYVPRWVSVDQTTWSIIGNLLGISWWISSYLHFALSAFDLFL